MRQPPENSAQGRNWSVAEKPRPERMAAARLGAECASISTSRVWISAIRCGRVALALLQLVEELLEVRREPGFGAQALLEPFGHGIGDRTAGAPVDLFAVIGKRASHRRVPCSQRRDTVSSPWLPNGFATRGDC